MKYNKVLLWMPFLVLFLIQIPAFAQKKAPEIADSLIGDLKTAKEDTFKVRLLIHIAETYLSINPALGVSYAEKGFALAEKMNYKRGMANGQNALGLTIGDSGNNEQARLHYLKAYELNKEIGNTIGTVNNLNNIGRTLQRESKFVEAIDYFFKALKIAEELKSDAQISMLSTNLATSYYQQMNFPRAMEYAKMAVKYGEISHATSNTGKGLLQIGAIKMETGDTLGARSYFQKSLKLYSDLGDQTNILMILANLALLEYPDYRKAITLMLKAKKVADENGPSSVSAISNISNLGRAYYDLALVSPVTEKKKLFDSAEIFLQRGMELSRSTNNLANLATLSINLADVESGTGDYKNAVNHFRNYIKINDSIYSQQSKNKLAGLEEKYKIDLKDKEIAINKLELGSQRRTQIALTGGLALLAIIGGLLWRQNQARKKSNTILMVLNNQLDEANKVKTKFFGILSHDLRSPISNLLNFLHLLRNDPQMISPEDQAVNQQQISQSAEQLLETMETMLLWSKEQMEHFKPEIKLIPVNDLFEYLQKFFSNAPPVKINFQNPEQLVVSGDENYLRVIMQNLTSNAIKALKNSPNAVIDWKVRKEGNRTVLTITDNGPGLNAEQTKSLYNENDVVNAKTGFGFHLIRDLAKAIQYRISVESQPGVGTTFVLSG